MANEKLSSGAGVWAYRSFYNNPDFSVSLDDLELGEGTLKINVDAHGQVSGTIGSDGWQLQLKGTQRPGEPVTLNFVGTGIVNGEKWEYSYLAYIVPPIHGSVKQVPALVGAVMRVIAHGDPAQHPAGLVGSFFAPLISR